jgi:hypothetical protein
VLVAALLGACDGAPVSTSGEITIEGTIEIAIVDGTDGDETKPGEEDEVAHFTERTLVYLTSDEGDLLELQLADDSDPSLLDTGDRVAATGKLVDGGALQCATPEAVAILEKPMWSAASGMNTTKRLAVILINFSNDTSQPITADYAKERIFTADTSANAFLDESSFGQVKMAGVADVTGDVFGWYTIADDNNDCDTSHWKQLAMQAANNDGKNLGAYTNHMFVFPGGSACTWAGLGAINGSWSFVKTAYMGRQTTAHELGHNLGLSHAGSYSCTANGARVTLSDTCMSGEYGDPFDVMGAVFRHPSGYAKARLGWLAPSNIKTITSAGAHIVDLAPLGTTTSEPQVLRVRRASHDDYYYVEYRQPTAVFDAFAVNQAVVNGVSIRLATDPSTRVATRLLDMNPATQTFHDAPLPVGATYFDPESKISIQLVSSSASGARVKVVVGAAATAPPPDMTAPTVALASPADGATVNGHVALSATAADDSGVTRVDFLVNNVVVGSDTMAPYGVVWKSPSSANATRTLGAKAYDAAGNVTLASTISVNVDNAVVAPELVENGGFEGNLMPWTKTGNVYYTSTSSYVHSGTGYVYLGSVQDAAGSLSQQITIPAGTERSLRYWLNVTTKETTTTDVHDRLYVEVKTTDGTLLKTLATHSNLDATFAGNYSEHAYSLAEFAGQAVVIELRVEADSASSSWFRVDDVSTL